MSSWQTLDPNSVSLGDPNIPDNWKVCIIEGVASGSDYNGQLLGARISSIFVILVLSTVATLFPVVATKVKSLRIPTYAYLFARHFGTGVIVTTAFVHLMDPAYGEIGPNTCVGMTGNWASYSWVAGIILATVWAIFLLDLVSSVYVQRKYGVSADHDVDVEGIVTKSVPPNPHRQEQLREQQLQQQEHQQDGILPQTKNDDIESTEQRYNNEKSDVSISEASTLEAEKGFQEQFAAFLILEFGVIFHSVMIGLNLGATGDEFKTLYIVLIFHQSFEGLGIGARLSAIPFPREKRWWPYALCIAYGLTTPICIAIGLGLRNVYASNSYTVNVVSGVLDAMSAGILIYTGLVELLARDYIFNEHRTQDLRRLTFTVVCNLLGAGLMALLGKWA